MKIIEGKCYICLKDAKDKIEIFIDNTGEIEEHYICSKHNREYNKIKKKTKSPEI